MDIMDDDVFDALIETLAIACENKPERLEKIKTDLLPRAGVSYLNVDRENHGKVIVHAYGRLYDGYMQEMSFKQDYHRDPLRDFTSFSSFGQPSAADIVTKFTVEIVCRGFR